MMDVEEYVALIRAYRFGLRTEDAGHVLADWLEEYGQTDNDRFIAWLLRHGTRCMELDLTVPIPRDGRLGRLRRYSHDKSPASVDEIMNSSTEGNLLVAFSHGDYLAVKLTTLLEEVPLPWLEGCGYTMVDNGLNVIMRRVYRIPDLLPLQDVSEIILLPKGGPCE